MLTCESLPWHSSIRLIVTISGPDSDAETVCVCVRARVQEQRGQEGYWCQNRFPVFMASSTGLRHGEGLGLLLLQVQMEQGHTHFDVLKCTSCASCGKPLGTAALNNELLHALLLSLLAWSCSRGERDAFPHMQHERHHET